MVKMILKLYSLILSDSQFLVVVITLTILMCCKVRRISIELTVKLSCQLHGPGGLVMGYGFSLKNVWFNGMCGGRDGMTGMTTTSVCQWIHLQMFFFFILSFLCPSLLQVVTLPPTLPLPSSGRW